MPRTLEAPIEARAYTQSQVAAMLQIGVTHLYERPDVMACRLPGRPVRYSKKKIDALLDGEAA